MAQCCGYWPAFRLFNIFWMQVPMTDWRDGGYSGAAPLIAYRLRGFWSSRSQPR